MLRDSILEELASIVGGENLLTSREELLCHGYDAQHLEGLPDAVFCAEAPEVSCIRTRPRYSSRHRRASGALAAAT